MDKYELITRIGDGTFGSVAKAVNKKNGQLVAIKKMKQKFYSWDQCVKLPEVEVVRKIHSHPNIVKLREVIRENNELFFVFEFLDCDLLSVIKKAKHLHRQEEMAISPAIPYCKIRNYMRQILQGIAYIHKKGYFHRDLKPENLLIRGNEADEVVKLADFGLAKETRSRPPFTDYVSTRWYRAPELLLQDRHYGPAVDIWAAGCVMAELITTRPLFPGSNEVDQLFKIMDVLGSPTEKTWPDGMVLAKKIRYLFPSMPGRGLAKVLPRHAPAPIVDLIAGMLAYDPKTRLTAEQCLQHAYLSVGLDEACGPSVRAAEQLAGVTRRAPAGPQSAPSGPPPPLPPPPAADPPRREAKPASEGVRAEGGPPLGGGVGRPAGKGLVPPAPLPPEDPTRSGLVDPLAAAPLPLGRKGPPPASLQPATLQKTAGSSSVGEAMEKDEPSPGKETTVRSGLKGMRLANIRPQVSGEGSRKPSGVAPLPARDAKGGTQPPASETSPFARAMPRNKVVPTVPKHPNESPKGAKKDGVNLEHLLEEFASEICNLGLQKRNSSLSWGQKCVAPSPKQDPAKLLLKNTRYKAPSIVPNNEETTAQGETTIRENCARSNSFDSENASGKGKTELLHQNVSPSIRALLSKYKASKHPP